MGERQYTTPLLVEDGLVVPLSRLPFGEKSYSEDWLQRLLFENPGLLPIAEIEPVFSGLLPVARELPTPAGPIDVVFINGEGLMTLVETKLWRNPEARRSVVAQAIDYAKEVAQWTYSDLVAAIKKANGAGAADPLAAMVSDSCDDFDERVFVDRVGRSLRLGRFLLLIVGDGIQEGVEEMADFLQKTPSLGYTLGLVEIALFRRPEQDKGPIFVQPRILARTVEVERAVVTIKVPIDPRDVEVTLPVPTVRERAGRHRITEEEFFEQLAASAGPQVVGFAKWALDEASNRGLEVQWGDRGPILKYVDEETGRAYSIWQLRRDGYLGQGKGGLPGGLRAKLMDETAKLIPGAARRVGHTKKAQEGGWEWLRMEDGELPPLSALVSCKEKWFDAIERAVEQVRAAGQ